MKNLLSMLLFAKSIPLLLSVNYSVPDLVPSSHRLSRPTANKPTSLPRGALNEIRSESGSLSSTSAFPNSSRPRGQSSPTKSCSSSHLRRIPFFPQRGGGTASSISSTAGPPPSPSDHSHKPIRVCFQGEAGAYSEKSLRELLGPNVIAVPRQNFEACYRAVASKECDYAIVPIENSLGGSIHENYDLMLRYDLTIVAEHEYRVRHCLLTKPGIDVKSIKYAISHSQALSQCDNYLRARGITPKPTYDTAGSAKMISKAIKGEVGRELPKGCTPDNTAAIASKLAGQTFFLECKEEGIEDDDSNFTRFLLLGRRGVVQYLNKKTPCKTSLVFTLPNSAGALYKSLACFSLRDIDMSKIESRPMSSGLLNYLKFRNTVTKLGAGRSPFSSAELPRFRYCFYLDLLASELDEGVQNALHHLREQSDYCRVLGSYPSQSRLVGPVAAAVEALNVANAGKTTSQASMRLGSLPSDEENDRQLNIGFVGYGLFGQYLSKKISGSHKVRCIDPLDKSKEATENNVEYFPNFETSKFFEGLDVVIVAVPMIEIEETLESLPLEKLRHKLVVEVCPLNVFPRAVLSRMLPSEADILCSNPMFGPGINPDEISWEGRPFVYEKVRISDMSRADSFLSIFDRERCHMVEMAAEDHDTYVADAEFVTHLTGRLLDRNLLPVTPVSSKEYSALCDVADMTANDTFDLFYGMFKYNERAKELLNKMRDNLASVERKLAAKEAYLEASAEMKNTDRQKLLAECRSLLGEVAKSYSHIKKEESEHIPQATPPTKLVKKDDN